MRPPTSPRFAPSSTPAPGGAAGTVRVPVGELLRLLGVTREDLAQMTGAEVVDALARVVRNSAVEDGDDSGTAPRRYTGVSREPQSARPAPLLLRVRDVAGLLAVSERVVWQLIRTGQLRPVHPAGLRATRLAAEDVEELARQWRAASQDGTVEVTNSKRGQYREDAEPL